MNRLALAIATCGYIGYVPLAPGTFGSAAGVAVFWAVRSAGSGALEVGVIAGLICAGVWSATIAERHFGRSDPGPVVIDEVVGMLITLALLPVSAAGVLVGFVAFRILDIVKPWPSRRLEALPGGFGVVGDDAMAALYGNVLMRGVIALAPEWLT